MSTEIPRVPLGSTALSVFPLALGGNVFGWTADEPTSFEVLDAYAAGGGNFLDTADSYSSWVPGNSGGESESIIGRWMASRGNRAEIVVATKVSQHPDFSGLAPANIAAAADASLQRLGIDVIDLYFAHFDDAATPLAETVAAFAGLVDAGKIRHIAVSNYSADRLAEWLAISAAEGFPAPVAVQPHYNLVERGIESDVLPVAHGAGLAVMPYFGLAKGFLAGKYRDGSEGGSPRAAAALSYLDDRGRRVLAALDRTAEAHSAEPASVALAWLRSQPDVVAPIASARTVDQLGALLASATLELTPEDLEALSAASA
jgi:aryl-alcohol dehydrogenase-like predicted oxidoreductase